MQKPALAALAMVLALGACGSVRDSRINPMNWFGRDSTETLAPSGGWGGEVDRRALVPVVTELEAIPTTGGALVRASGVTATQGWWDVELRPVNNARPVDGVLIYEFVVAEPRRATGTASEASRTVTAGVKVTHSRLAGVRSIVVRGAQNQRSVAR
ncbi:hypothetical protein LY56_00402 [Roseinatronobacter thiooxidans]|jgi:hypothetical protein|uniref:Lipoprotein n=1 Tax=Roseinatronobacter thiooxidans TaxID=121821 RepID=A0A2W7QJH0_9RHOB|nr:hypothetical protein [Roseinatronobacter thiooxidans]PZX48251.1 hypothetical protein LY56_00402 [Roseinatronobacter thiooxidans]